MNGFGILSDPGKNDLPGQQVTFDSVSKILGAMKRPAVDKDTEVILPEGFRLVVNNGFGFKVYYGDKLIREGQA